MLFIEMVLSSASMFRTSTKGLWAVAFMLAVLLAFPARATVTAAVQLYLQGALSPASTLNGLPMRTQLTGMVPTAGYAGFPFTDPYLGTVSVASLAAVPAGTVDWVEVQLLQGASAATCNPVFSTAGFLLSTGSVVDATGNPLTFPAAPPGNYNVRVVHRNHAALISNPVNLTSVAVTVDLTNAANLANPNNAKAFGGFVAALMGDVNGDKHINSNDINAILLFLGGNALAIVSAYASQDANLNGKVSYTSPGNDPLAMLGSALGGNLALDISIPDTLPLGGTCGAPANPVNPTSVPTLSEWGLICLVALLLFFGATASRLFAAVGRGEKTGVMLQ